MREETVRTYIDEIVYISDDGLKRSKYKADIEEYENELSVNKSVEQFIVGKLDMKKLKFIRNLGLIDGYGFPEIYKVNDYKDFIFLVGKLASKHHVIPNEYDIDDYKNVDFSTLYFIFSEVENYDSYDELNFYCLNRVKEDLQLLFMKADETLTDLKQLIE